MRGGVLGRAQQGLLNRPAELTPEALGMLRAISPINHERPGLPPFLLLRGDAAKSAPIEQSLAFQAKLRTHGGSCDLITLTGAPHGLTQWSKFMPDHSARTIAWLRGILAEPQAALSSSPTGTRP